MARVKGPRAGGWRGKGHSHLQLISLLGSRGRKGEKRDGSSSLNSVGRVCSYIVTKGFYRLVCFVLFLDVKFV